MLVSKSFKFRLYPNKAQSEAINKNIGCCRFIYNAMLAVAANKENTHDKDSSSFGLAF